LLKRPHELCSWTVVQPPLQAKFSAGGNDRWSIVLAQPFRVRTHAGGGPRALNFRMW
jgi:hypothetical protein